MQAAPAGRHRAAALVEPRAAFSIEQACQTIGVSRPTLYKLMRQGRLRSVMLGGRRVIPADAIAELLAG
jgi:excisionase family DNA binding protein